MEKVRVVLYGVGAVGGLIARHLLEKGGVKIVGAIDQRRGVGRDLGEVIDIGDRLGVIVSDDEDAILSEAKADVVLHATTSFLKQVYPQIAKALEHGANVISTCEELSYPYIVDPNLARKLDALAKKHGATVLGTGVNPGFVMDTLPVVLTGVCQRVEEIKVTRSLDAAKRRIPFQKKIGAGLTVKEFKEKIGEKKITAHVGLSQSISLIASALGWELDKIEMAPIEPVIAEKRVASRLKGGVFVEPGQVAGIRQVGWGVVSGEKAITLNLNMYMGAEEYEQYTIEGMPRINMKNKPSIHGDVATVAMIVNSIPKVLKAQPGLVTMKDLLIPSATPEDMRNYIVRC